MNELVAAMRKLIAACRLHAPSTPYSCSECGASVQVGDSIVRNCEHETASIIADASAVAAGSGSLHGIQ